MCVCVCAHMYTHTHGRVCIYGSSCVGGLFKGGGGGGLCFFAQQKTALHTTTPRFPRAYTHVRAYHTHHM
jgi:hypothetical protein